MAPFEGFDLSNPSAKLLHTMLKENSPDYLLDNSIKWNFTKFLIDKEGNVVKRFESSVEPNEISSYVKKLL
jgi:glutathione peroxidase